MESSWLKLIIRRCSWYRLLYKTWPPYNVACMYRKLKYCFNAFLFYLRIPHQDKCGHRQRTQFFLYCGSCSANYMVELAYQLVAEEQFLRDQRRKQRRLEFRLHQCWEEYEEDARTDTQLLSECGRIYGPSNDCHLMFWLDQCEDNNGLYIQLWYYMCHLFWSQFCYLNYSYHKYLSSIIFIILNLYWYLGLNKDLLIKCLL